MASLLAERQLAEFFELVATRRSFHGSDLCLVRGILMIAGALEDDFTMNELSSVTNQWLRDDSLLLRILRTSEPFVGRPVSVLVSLILENHE